LHAFSYTISIMLDVEDIMARYRRSKARILETSHADEIHLKSKRVVPRPLLLIGFGGKFC